MKVILDVSVLGLGYYYEKSRTGVFRVVEQLAGGLADSNELDLTFSANQQLPAAIRYIRETLNDEETPFAHRNDQIMLGNVKNIIMKNFPHNSFPQKAFRKIISKIQPADFQLAKSLINGSNIFHSPYFPIPRPLSVYPGIKKIVTVHDLIPVKHPHFFGFQTDHVIKKVVESISPDDFAFCVSESTKADLCELSDITEDRIFVNHLAASPDIFYQEKQPSRIRKALQKYHIPEENSYFLSICTLEPRKNVDSVIRSFVNLVEQEKIKDLNLVLVGTKGWDFDKIFEEIDGAKSVKNRIIVTGYADDEDLASIYSGAMAFVYVSICEGFGLPPLEAMQCGVPVIASNTTSLPEVVGDAGILVTPTDQDAISHAMYQIYHNAQYRISLSQKSLERARLFTWQKFIDKTVETYQIIS